MTLTQLFTAIANAIRGKTGSSETIKAEDFPTEINSIPTGGSYPPDWSEIGYEDTPQDIINGFNYAKEIQENWDSTVTNLTSEFAGDTNLKYMPLVDTSNVSNMRYMFNGCTLLQNVPLFNTINVNNMYGMFSGCVALKNVPLFDTSEVTTMRNMFSNCTSLISVPQFNTDSINTSTSFGGMFSYCNNLSNESLNNILAMCKNATSYTGTKTLKYIGLSSAQATTCQSLSNWSAFTSAGWTTGY